MKARSPHRCKTCDLDFIGDYCPKCVPEEIPQPAITLSPVFRIALVVLACLASAFIALIVMALKP